HTQGIAADIYLGAGKFGEEAPCISPGKIVCIKKVRTPVPKSFDAEETDYLIILKSEENPKYLIKILHVNPKVKVGDSLEVGDCIGTLIRSGFFNFWTDPHIHVEIRDPADAIRARGAYPIRLLSLKRIGCPELSSSFKCKVIDVRTDYAMVEPENKVVIRMGRFCGFAVKVNREFGILDCGFPHYVFGGVLLEKSGFDFGQKVFIGDIHIGNIVKKQQNFAVVKLNPLSIKCGEDDLRGLSLYINLKRPLVKLIPKRRERLNLSEGEEIIITVAPKKEE
ncbi:MAG: hypothetical protein QXV37_03155, partial [Candidatus Jordarchaeaceae archaeon]